jgi:N-acetylglucosamine-6-phosphate deacetylase
MHSITISGRDPATGHRIRVLIEDDRIASIEPCEAHDAVEENVWLSHGLIDLQVNGYRGYDFNADTLTVAAVVDLTREILRTGVTSYAPTLITGPAERSLYILGVIARARASDPVVAACIPWVHMEGPSISPLDGYRGAHPLSDVREPSLREFDAWQKASGDLVGMVTLSPHWPGTSAYIAALVRRGVHVAIGHTHATADQIRSAVDAGATLSTHLGNAVPSRIERHPNSIWSQLAEGRLSASFIADGFHLPEEVLRVMLKVKGFERSILVSDSVALAGMPAGRYTSAIGDEVELSSNGLLSQCGSGLLAGSVIPLIDCVGECMRMTNCSLSAALRMATQTPAHLAGIEGTLKVGARADVLQLGWHPGSFTLQPLAVWLGGRQV